MGARVESWRGRTVLITGASRGIGRALAERLAERGARLALLARDTDALAALAAGLPTEAHAFACDVDDRDAQQHAIAEAERTLGGVQVGVLNAGIGVYGSFLETDLDEAERVMRTNVLGVIVGAQALGRSMAARGRGHLVIMSSIAGLLAVPNEAVYSASKHAVQGLADALAIELAPRGVHVLSVCPGAVRTGFVDDAHRHAVARATAIAPERVADRTIRALERGHHRVIVPRPLAVAAAIQGLAPDLVRSGTRLATRT
ncbi:MAG: SDR family NAD(P)-dependent oxidoreductase [Sandaracinaceae bacterium]